MLQYLILGLLGWGIVGPLGVYGWQKVEGIIQRRAAVSAAVIKTKHEEEAQCAVRITRITKDIEDDTERRIQQAKDAVAALAPTPADDAGVRSLCERSASCRDRKGK